MILYIVQTKSSSKTQTRVQNDKHIYHSFFGFLHNKYEYMVSVANMKTFLAIPRDYFTQIYEADMFKVDGVKRDKTAMKIILQSLARNHSTLSKTTSILSDVNATKSLSDNTLNDYIKVLEELFVIEDLKGRCPPLDQKVPYVVEGKRSS